MTHAHVIDGKLLADKIIAEQKRNIAQLKNGPPGLATVLVGNNPASNLYVKNKRKRAAEVGIRSIHHDVDDNISQSDLLRLIELLNNDRTVHAILVQMPLPRHIHVDAIVDAIHPDKDVDGFHPINQGYLACARPHIVPCTPLGVMEIIDSVNYSLRSKHAVVVGRSSIVGKPMAQLLLNRDATVTICHKETTNLQDITSQADMVVSAVGQPNLIRREHIKKGAFVIDVGINRVNNKICGDVDFVSVRSQASFITPVPGGVGPLTIAMLLKNTVECFLRTT